MKQKHTKYTQINASKSVHSDFSTRQPHQTSVWSLAGHAVRVQSS